MDTKYNLTSTDIGVLSTLQAKLGSENPTIYVDGLNTPTRVRISRLIKDGLVVVAPGKSPAYLTIVTVTIP